MTVTTAIIPPPYRIAKLPDERMDWLCVTPGDFVLRVFCKIDLIPSFWNAGMVWQSLSMPVRAYNTLSETSYVISPHACKTAKTMAPPSNQRNALAMRNHIQNCDQCTAALRQAVQVVQRRRPVDDDRSIPGYTKLFQSSRPTA